MSDDTIKKDEETTETTETETKEQPNPRVRGRRLTTSVRGGALAVATQSCYNLSGGGGGMYTVDCPASGASTWSCR